ncbi:sulfotransferase [Lamprobacter modestohalophilus]|uniref:sulfotransferase family protein n=1 Tax=Lamprobacter modestohalophilus TaxID=1064514 RepID=UPI002ADEF67F|nr:sulfotransferase [Lamprobacter modestohalophilus]MEA1051635.1 sulfotransferase [Lamprobacter modestohalophilus]
MQKKIHFIIVGGQRCGTTWLSRLLETHPAIRMAKPLKPEPKYFLRSDVSYAGYMNAFFSDDQCQVLGEKSTSYYELPEVAQKINKLIPSSKIVFMLRNPVDRAISNYYFTCYHGYETRSPEETFLFNKPLPTVKPNTSVNPFNYVERGFYSKFITEYIKIFGSARVKCINFERAISDFSEIEQLYEFLSVEKRPCPVQFSSKYNEGLNFKAVPVLVRNRLVEIYQDELQVMANYLDVSNWMR